MNLKELKEIIDIVSEKGFAEFEIERQGFRLRITRFSEQPVSASQPAAEHSANKPAAVEPLPKAALQEVSRPPVASGVPAVAAQKRMAEAAAAAEPALHLIRAPIVGTFFRSPSPDSDPFVEVGSRVGPDSVVCIIEAMKLMNEIQAEISGTVEQIFAENGMPVEYDQPLFGIRT
jgi:acetyl-CoA carboxylase biotin carboxyl carrier protein